MKKTHDKLQRRVCSKDQAAELAALFDQIPDSRWVTRNRINSKPTNSDGTCHYQVFFERNMSAEMLEALRKVAPKLERTWLDEIIVNRYLPGMYMPEHVDLDMNRYNVVVQISDSGDGIEVEGEFIPDDPGMATIFPVPSPPHAVPPVKHKRYVLIFLYV